jgi:hypothetical protein
MLFTLKIPETTNIISFSNWFLTLYPLLATLKVLKINPSGMSQDVMVRVLQGWTVGSRDPENKLITGSQNPPIIQLKRVWG